MNGWEIDGWCLGGLLFAAWSCGCYLLGRWHENRWVGESVGRWVRAWHARVNGQEQAGR